MKNLGMRKISDLLMNKINDCYKKRSNYLEIISSISEGLKINCRTQSSRSKDSQGPSNSSSKR